jgi:hypothetical protein
MIGSIDGGISTNKQNKAIKPLSTAQSATIWQSLSCCPTELSSHAHAEIKMYCIDTEGFRIRVGHIFSKTWSYLSRGHPNRVTPLGYSRRPPKKLIERAS